MTKHLIVALQWSMHKMLLVFQVAAEARANAEPHAITYVDFLTVTLTAVCAMLAVLAIGIGALAVWGYTGIKEARNSITADASRKVDDALASKLSEYPKAAEMIDVFENFKRQSDFMEMLRNQMTSVESNSVVQASKQEEDGLAEQFGVSIAQDYPTEQEVKEDANDQSTK